MTRLLSGIVLSAVLIAGCTTTAPRGESPDYDKGNAKPVTVKQTERGAQITSDERILFETGSADPKKDGAVFLDRVAKILTEKTKANVAIEGHTDNVGSPAFNQSLSEKRATAVKAALVARGVDAKRLQSAGFGMTRPIADNGSPDGRQANRRTEIIVLNESVANIGGSSLGDRLSEGLDRFLKDASAMIKSAFGGSSDTEK